MSDRRRIPHIPRTGRPGPPRRKVAALAAVVAIVAMAAVIGSHDPGGSGTKVSQSATAADSGGRLADATGPSGSSAGSGAASELGSDTDAAAPDATATAGGDAVAPSTGKVDALPKTASDGSTLQPKIVRTGSLGLVVKRGTFGQAVSKLTATANGVGGFVASSETSQLGSDPHGTVTLRVPAKQFDQVLQRIDGLGTVASVTTGSQDVTGEYTDVAARIKTLQDEREQISLVLGRAESIPDILSVRDRLNTVQGELEQLQGRQKVLDDQTSLSTITVDVSEKGSGQTIGTRPPADRAGLSKLWHDVADRFGDGGRSIALGLAVMAPWLLLALVLWFPARLLWRRGLAATEPATAPAAADPVPVTTVD